MITYFVFNIAYARAAENNSGDIWNPGIKDIWNAIYYIGTIQAYVFLGLIRTRYESKYDKRIRKTFVFLQLPILLDKMLLFNDVYREWYYGVSSFNLGITECIICIIAAIYIIYGRLG